MSPDIRLSPEKRKLCAGGVRGMLLGCLFPLGALLFLAVIGEPLGHPAELHRRYPLLFVIDLAPIVLGAAGCWIGALLHRTREAEYEQRKLATTLAQIWSEGAVAQDADIESLLRNGYRRTAAVSHELRTPLTAIVGFLDLMDDEVGDDGTACDYLAEIRSSCDFMLGLINEYLEAERSVAGVFKVEPEPVHLEEAIRSVIRLLTPVAHQRSLTLGFGSNGSHVVMADPRRLQQVLTNLIANALNYTPHGGVTLSTSTRDGEAVVEITDTGVGMTESETARLFAPFQRGEAGHTSGTGLGLSLARSMMEAMDGSVSAHSDGPGRGTTMRITLQLEREPALQAS